MANSNIEVQYALGNKNSDSVLLPSVDKFEKWVNSALNVVKESGSVCLRIVDVEEMVALNQQFRGKQGVTNVLSFPADLASADLINVEIEEKLLGDIAICADVVASEAREQGKLTDNHWAHMTIHGVLHLLGYDHQSDIEADQMESLEAKILTDLDIPDPYHV